MYWQICSWTGVMPSSGNSFYQSSSHLLSFDNGTGCWHGAGSWDSPPLYASGTCQRWKCSLFFFSITMENGNAGWASRLGSNPCLEHVVNCQGMGGLASSSVAAVLRMGIQSGPCHHGRPGGNFKPALFLQSKVYFWPSNSCLSLVLAIELQNRVSSTI